MPATKERSFQGSEAAPHLFREPVSKGESYLEVKEPRPPIRSFAGDDDEEDNRSFVQRYRVAIGVIAVAVIAVVFAIRMIARSGPSPRRESSLVLISVPTPPPPPPVQTAPPEPKMDEQTFQPEDKPVEEPPKPPDQPPIGTNIKGDGTANSFGLGNSGGNGFGSRAGSASRFGWYAGQVQSKISEALRNNRKTHTAEMSIRARIWPDATGRITRAQLAGSTGDPSLDSVIQNEVLSGLQLREPPPAGMPLPIVLQLTARRPH